MNIQIKQVESNDYLSILEILKNASLPFTDIPSNLFHFFKAESEGKIVGVIGLEIYNEYALLRSLAVLEEAKNKGLGKLLINKVLAYASENKIKEVYLLTTTADKYFEKIGFELINREQVPLKIKESEQFIETCPSTALVLKKIIYN